MIKKVLYVEISTAHTEIIKSFVEALTPEYEVHLLINEKSKTRISHLEKKINVQYLDETKYLRQIVAYKKKINPDILFLNSAQGRKIRDLCLRLFFDKTPIFGVHHNAENLYQSFTQKIISHKIKKYIVLADFIKTFLQKKIKPDLQVESFYPLQYHQMRKTAVDQRFQYIAIPGVLEQDRRDYLGLVEMVHQQQKNLPPDLKFVLLGNSKNHDGPQILKKIKDSQVESFFIFFDQYVEDDMMLSYVQNCTAIMPLLHPGLRWFDQYFETKISGAYSLAFAYDKKLLMHEIFRGKPEFRVHGEYYSPENFAQILSRIRPKAGVEKLAKFEFKFQKKKLLQFFSSAH